MSTIRKAFAEPTFKLYENEKELSLLLNEIKKTKPKIEVTLENFSESAQGSIQEWHPNRKFFTVKWDQKSEAFDQKIESNSELRVYFKAKLFSTQIIFKSLTLRRLNDTLFHFRIPAQIFKQQRRAALRVPIQNNSAKLVTPLGEFRILDLSVTGATILASSTQLNSKLQNVVLENCELHLGKIKIKTSDLSIKIVKIEEQIVGIKFQGLSQLYQNRIKQYLIEQLKVYYQTL